MKKIVTLLTTTEGRIGRGQWWIGVAAMIVTSIVAVTIFNTLSFGKPVVAEWLAVLFNLAMLWPTYNLGVKRRHDRNNDGKDLKILLWASVPLYLLTEASIGFDVAYDGNEFLPQPPFWLVIFYAIFVITSINMLVQLGFRKGTTGTNSHGADPVGAAA